MAKKGSRRPRVDSLETIFVAFSVRASRVCWRIRFLRVVGTQRRLYASMNVRRICIRRGMKMGEYASEREGSRSPQRPNEWWRIIIARSAVSGRRECSWSVPITVQTCNTPTYVTTDKRSALSLPVARKGTQNWCLVFGLTGLNFGMRFLLFIWQGEHGLRELTRMFVGSPICWGIASLNRGSH